MSFCRSVLLLCLGCLLLSFALLALGSTMGYEEFRGGYAVLAFDVSIEDSVLRELLYAGEKSFAGSPVSESSQWVMLDNFNSLEAVPLDKYFTRLSSFDPRNDGYAEKLRDIFIRDGKRFVYIPLGQGNWNPQRLDKQFAGLLEGIPFSVDYYGIEKPVMLFFACYAAASLCLLIICYVKKSTRHAAANIAFLVPVLSSLAFFGAEGIACAAVLFGLFILLKEPLNELSAILWPFGGNVQSQKSVYKDVLKPYGRHWFFLPLFAAAPGIIVIFSQLKLLFLLVVFACALAVFFFSLRVLSLSGGEHRRFTPVLIMRRRVVDFAFSACMLPLIAAAFLAVFLTPYMPGAYASGEKFDVTIGEQDYYAHLSYQAGFSTRQLGTSFAAYPDYIFDEDGLPSQKGNSGAAYAINADDFPAFPLGHLMEFFQRVNSMEKTGGGGKTGGFAEIPPLMVLLLFVIPVFFIKRNDNYMQRDNIEGIKRFSGKPRLQGSRVNMLLYNDRNMSRVRKDA